MGVLRAMLSMHRSPRRDEDEEYGGSQDDIQGAPRVLTIDQVCSLLLALACFIVFV